MKLENGKNTIKYNSYKYAFDRMKEAIEKEFFLEAVMIAESIISDRLVSYLRSKKKETYLSKLIDKWEEVDGQVSWKERPDLVVDLKSWRKERNICAHQVVKSLPGESTKSVEEFIKIARNCALEGQILARYVCDWRNAQKKKGTVESDGS